MALSRIKIISFIFALLALAGGGMTAYYLSTSPEEKADQIFAASFNDLSGNPQSLKQWQGKVLIINFWATWCAPCREEIPIFVNLHQKHVQKDVQFVGIAVDNAAKIQDFVANMSITYPILVGDLNAIELSRQLGNRVGGLPFTVIFNRDGNIAFSRLGVITFAEIEAVINKTASNTR